MGEGLIHSIRKLLLDFFDRVRSFTYRFEKAIGIAGNILSVLCFIAAVSCLVCLLVYVGFDHTDVDHGLLRRVLVICQGIFLFNIAFNTVFRFTKTWRISHPLHRITDLALILTLIPALWPHINTIRSIAHFLQSPYYLYGLMSLYSIGEICYGIMNLLGRRTNPSLILSASYIFFILIGSFILMMPRCTAEPVSYTDSLFLAASAVSMTGMTTVDLATAYTPLGWCVVAILMQIGALGVLTFTSFFAVFFSGRQSIYNQLLIRDFMYSKSMSALIPVMLYILVFTIVIEAVGSICLYFSLPDNFLDDTNSRILFSVFHSMSGFCNGGFTTLPQGLETPVLMQGNQWFYILMSILIFAGGIGFPNLVNIKDAVTEYLRRFKAKITGIPFDSRHSHVYDLNTRIVMRASAVLFIGGAVLFFILEYHGVLEGMPLDKKIAQSVFNSVTPRTAGFGSLNILAFSHVTFLIMMLLMWIGCSSQSMGGGIKVNTFMVVLFNLRSTVRGDKGVVALERNIAIPSVRRANAVVCLSIFAVFFYSVIIMALQPELGMKEVMFECFSAITTVGLSLGITPELSTASKMVLTTAMFLGRVGIISVLSGLTSNNHHDRSDYLPTDNIIIN